MAVVWLLILWPLPKNSSTFQNILVVGDSIYFYESKKADTATYKFSKEYVGDQSFLFPNACFYLQGLPFGAVFKEILEHRPRI
jgi:hypothetical protein